MSRRAKGEGSVYFDSSRECRIGAAEAGFNPKTGAGRRVKVNGKPGESRSSVAARLRARMLELEEADRAPETVGESSRRGGREPHRDASLSRRWQ